MGDREIGRLRIGDPKITNKSEGGQNVITEQVASRRPWVVRRGRRSVRSKGKVVYKHGADWKGEMRNRYRFGEMRYGRALPSGEGGRVPQVPKRFEVGGCGSAWRWYVCAR